MKTYIHNLYLWLIGFGKFKTLRFHDGWSANQWGWRLLYTFDYGSHVLTGGACVSWSRWFYDNRSRPVPNFFNRLLNHVDTDHCKRAGPTLWKTVDCKARTRVFVTVAPWVLLYYIIVHMVTVRG